MKRMQASYVVSRYEDNVGRHTLAVEDVESRDWIPDRRDWFESQRLVPLDTLYKRDIKSKLK